MSESSKQALDVLKFIFSIVISILVAALGYMMTNKLEAIENQLEKMNSAIHNQMVINNTLQFRIEILEKRLDEFEY